jgi:hypothetical protein
MKFLKYLALTAAAALVFSLGAFAKDSNSGSFDLAQAANIGSTMLQPGHYKAEWTGPSNALQVSIVEHGKTVARTQGHIKELPTKAPYSDVVIRTTGSQNVDEIDFANRTDALVLTRS